MANCPLCQSAAQITRHQKDPHSTVECKVCGTYTAQDRVVATNDWAKNRHLVSAMTKLTPLKSGEPIFVDHELLAKASNGEIADPSFTDKRESLLSWYAFLSEKDPRSKYGSHVPYDSGTDYPAAYCHNTNDGNPNEWEFIRKPLERSGLLEHVGNGIVRITDKGWEHLESRAIGRGNQGFIAIAFKDELADARKAIEAAVAAAGFEPRVIDQIEYVGGVMDQVISEIRQSRFVVADLTMNRGGVYYEAGFATALNKTVIPLCRYDHIDDNTIDKTLRIHFDVRHLNILTWTDDKLPELQRRLTDRIKALFGPGARRRARQSGEV